MPGLTERQSTVIGSLFAAAPDAAVRRLERALSEDVGQGGRLAQVYALAAREAAERRLRATVFSPVLPLCRPSPFADPRFPAAIIPRLWAALRATRPESVAEAEAVCLDPQGGAFAPALVYNALCASAADGLRGDAAAFAPARGLLAADAGDALTLFTAYLDLAPLARRALAGLPDWLGRLGKDGGAGARIIYKDAVAVADDAGPRLVSLLMAHLNEPWRVLRVLAAVVLQPNDHALANSELARFGDYVLADIEAHLAAFDRFEPAAGREAGLAAAGHLHVAAQEIAEFETTLELGRDGPWGAPVAHSKQLLAELAEARLALIEKAVDQALPWHFVRVGKGLKEAPRLTGAPDPLAARRAEGLLGFLEGVRVCAATSGFGAARARVGEAVKARVDQYVDDLLETMRAEEAPDPARSLAYLEIAADLMAEIRGAKAARIVRRRAAAG
jgi:hypothetical protein